MNSRIEIDERGMGWDDRDLEMKERMGHGRMDLHRSDHQEPFGGRNSEVYTYKKIVTPPQ